MMQNIRTLSKAMADREEEVILGPMGAGSMASRLQL